MEKRGLSGRRGPKPTLLELNPKSLYVIGIEINPSYLYIGLFNFVGEVKDKFRIPLGSDHSVEHVISLLNKNIGEFASRVQDQILGAGVTLSGSVSSDGNISLSSPMGWRDVPLKSLLANNFGFPVYIYSNRVRLLAEFEIEPELSSKNILYLNLANGVGSTIYMNGKLVFGATGRYGEIGHIVIEPEGPKCGCGNYGCVEALISGPALALKIKNDYQKGNAPVFNDFLRTGKAATPEEILSFWAQAAEKGDPYSIELRQRVIDHFSTITALAINCYDPDVLILAGYISLLFPGFLAQSIRTKMQKDVYDIALRNIEICFAKAGEDAVIKGVAAAVLHDSLALMW